MFIVEGTKWYDITSESMRGGTTLVTVRPKGSHEIIMFGSYRYDRDGYICIPDGANLSLSVISEIHADLLVMFPEMTWVVTFAKGHRNYNDLEKVFTQKESSNQ